LSRKGGCWGFLCCWVLLREDVWETIERKLKLSLKWDGCQHMTTFVEIPTSASDADPCNAVGPTKVSCHYKGGRKWTTNIKSS
jgi:hypothetical protein